MRIGKQQLFKAITLGAPIWAKFSRTLSFLKTIATPTLIPDPQACGWSKNVAAYEALFGGDIMGSNWAMLDIKRFNTWSEVHGLI